MKPASELRPGMALRLQGVLYRVLAADSHAGGGKMGAVTHARLKNLATGTVTERRFRADETVEEILPERQTLQFLYSDERSGYFMHLESFEQIEVESARLGKARLWLREGMSVPVEFVEGTAVGITFPDTVEARIADTAAPQHHQGISNVWKEARLENGVTVMVPPFIGPGELIRVNVETGEYVERAKGERR
jgi:elongation factor P